MTPSPLLIKAVRESRLEISQEYTALCSELDFQKKIKNSFKQHPFFWLGGAVSAGLLTTLFGFKRSAYPASTAATTAVKAIGSAGAISKVGWVASAFEIGKFLYPILRPMVVDFANKSMQRNLAKRPGTS
jgi:hypothetical protein